MANTIIKRMMDEIDTITKLEAAANAANTSLEKLADEFEAVGEGETKEVKISIKSEVTAKIKCSASHNNEYWYYVEFKINKKDKWLNVLLDNVADCDYDRDSDYCFDGGDEKVIESLFPKETKALKKLARQKEKVYSDKIKAIAKKLKMNVCDVEVIIQEFAETFCEDDDE